MSTGRPARLASSSAASSGSASISRAAASSVPAGPDHGRAGLGELGLDLERDQRLVLDDEHPAPGEGARRAAARAQVRTPRAAASGSAAGSSGSGRPISQARPSSSARRTAVPPLAARLRSISAKPKPGGRRGRGGGCAAPGSRQSSTSRRPSGPASTCQPTVSRPSRPREGAVAPGVLGELVQHQRHLDRHRGSSITAGPSTATRAAAVGGRARRRRSPRGRPGHLAGDQQVVHAGERLHPAAEAPHEGLGAGAAPERLAGDRLDRRQRVAHPVVQLLEQLALRRLGLLAGADVAGDLRGADHPPGRVADRRDGQRHREPPAVLGDPLGVEMRDPLAAPQPGEDLVLLEPAARAG